MHLACKETIALLLILTTVVVSGCVEQPESEDPALPQLIEMDPGGDITMEVGGVDTAGAVVMGARSGVTYTSSHPSVATVNASTGVITAVAPGVTAITATAVRATEPLASSVSVTVVPVGSMQTAMTHRAMVGIMINEVCPNNEESIFADTLPISAEVRAIHEFHDCQRLVSNGAYGPLVGIFAHKNVARFLNPLNFADGMLAAVILNFKRDQTYEPLGIRPGTNCLILKYTKRIWEPTGTWEAALVPKPAPSSTQPYGDCSDKMNWDSVPDLQKDLLVVKRLENGASPLGLPLSPPVARWDWNAARSQNTMGVRCGVKGWCEIGPSGFTPLPALPAPLGRKLIKGYYDQQYLAGPDGQLSDVWGTLTPGEDAKHGRLDRDSTWYKAVEFDLDSPGAGSPAYNFYLTRLFLTPVTASGKVRSKGIMEVYSKRSEKNWKARIGPNPVPGGGELEHRNHSSDKGNRLSTVRWRWNAEDETVWTYCPEDGCCELKSLY
jgi:hypothetical protein